MRFIYKTHYNQDIRLLQHGGHWFWYGLLLAALLVLPWVASRYLLDQVILIGIYSIAGLGLMLLLIAGTVTLIGAWLETRGDSPPPGTPGGGWGGGRVGEVYRCAIRPAPSPLPECHEGELMRCHPRQYGRERNHMRFHARRDGEGDHRQQHPSAQRQEQGYRDEKHAEDVHMTVSGGLKDRQWVPREQRRVPRTAVHYR